MMQLYNIKFQSTTKQFSAQSRKLIRFSVKNITKATKYKCKFVNEATIKWQQKVRIQQLYNQDIDFQIYNQHEFGYNPEELGNLLYGVIRLSEGRSMGKWEVLSSASDGKRIGYLYIDYQKATKQPTLSTKTDQNKVSKIISSILVRNLNTCPESAYLVINTAKKNYKSQSITPIKGQFFFNLMFKSDSYLIKLNDSSQEVKVTFHDYQNDKVIGKSIYSFNNQGSLIRLDLQDQLNDAKVGQIYFQIQKQQQKPKKSAKVQKTQNQRSVEALQKVQKQMFNAKASITQKTVNQPKSKQSMGISKIRSFSTTNLSRIGQSQFLGTSRKKRVSVVHNNGDVVFPSEKRFMIYQDKQTNIISYSKLPSMKFEQQHSKKYYKGASIGKGDKYDFTFFYKQNPGVGQYKLPSIFDRY